MRELGLSTLMVVDSDRRFRGYVRIDDVIDLENKAKDEKRPAGEVTVKEVLKTDGLTVAPETPIVDLLTDASRTTLPFAVVDDENRLKGIVTRPAILAGIAGD
jgi:glycine betaine/proline transport system ATP-binding protein